ncbi:MAG: hypothetical protein HYZ08_02615 [Candidatus Kerfeldbacteria bacterium]|nr:hypothetical protein [Candidatus Kerfeldbacteria bacterium]
MNASPVQLRPKDHALWNAFEQSLRGEVVQYFDIRKAVENHVDCVIFPNPKAHQQFVSELRKLVETLTRSCISYVLIKTEKRYLYEDSNIDIVCQTEEDFQKAQDIAACDSRVRTTSFHEPDKEMWRKIENGNERQPGWHLHRGVTWNGVPYLTNDSLFQKRRRVSVEGIEFWAPSLEHDLLIHAGHTVFENFQVTLGEFYDAALRTQEPLDWEFMHRESEREGWGFAFRLFLSALAGFGASVPGLISIPNAPTPYRAMIRFPERYPGVFQLWAFSERIIHNLRHANFGFAFREMYAYPAFYLIEKFKQFTGIRYP